MDRKERKRALYEMTPEQALDELSMMEVQKMLQKARRAYKKAQEAESAVYRQLLDLCLDLDAPTEAENAETLEEAVACYLNYGEFTLSGLMTEIRAQYITED